MLVTLNPTFLSIIVEYNEKSAVFFREFVQRRHKACCIPFLYMTNKGCDEFHCHSWYSRGVTSEYRLGLDTCFARAAFDLHCQVRKMIDTMRGINDYTVVCHVVETYN